MCLEFTEARVQDKCALNAGLAYHSKCQQLPCGVWTPCGIRQISSPLFNISCILHVDDYVKMNNTRNTDVGTSLVL